MKKKRNKENRYQKMMRYVILYAIAGTGRGKIAIKMERLPSGLIVKLRMAKTIDEVPHAIINGVPTLFGGLPGSSMLFIEQGVERKRGLQDINDSGAPNRSAVEWFRTKAQEHLVATPETLSVTFSIDAMELLIAEMGLIEGLLLEVVDYFGTTPESVLEAMGTQRLAGRLFEKSRPEMVYGGGVITFGAECRNPVM